VRQAFESPLGTPHFSVAWVHCSLRALLTKLFSTYANLQVGGPRAVPSAGSRRKRPFFSRRRDTLFIRQRADREFLWTGNAGLQLGGSFLFLGAPWERRTSVRHG